MEALVALIQDWGPPFLGWVLAGWLLWERRSFPKMLVEIITGSTQATNEHTRAIASLESKIEKLL